jgi:hypothetical protein
MADIIASAPVTQPAVGSMVYDKWFMTQLVGKFGPEKGPTIVTLQRANLTNGVWTLMPNTTPEATVTFNVDIFKEMTNGNATLASAFNAVVEAIDAYATSKKLL